MFLERRSEITIKAENVYTLLADLQPTTYHPSTLAQVYKHAEKALPHIHFPTVKTKTRKPQKITQMSINKAIVK